MVPRKRIKQMTATLNINLTEGLTAAELEQIAARASEDSTTIEQIILDAIRARLAARRPQPPAIAA